MYGRRDIIKYLSFFFFLFLFVSFLAASRIFCLAMCWQHCVRRSFIRDMFFLCRKSRHLARCQHFSFFFFIYLNRRRFLLIMLRQWQHLQPCEKVTKTAEQAKNNEMNDERTKKMKIKIAFRFVSFVLRMNNYGMTLNKHFECFFFSSSGVRVEKRWCSHALVLEWFRIQRKLYTTRTSQIVA